MKVGTKSVLFGAHCFFIHPWFVALAWWKLYGFPFDPRLWVAFFVHDLGYWGKPNMDGMEGESHPEFGANVMHLLFDRSIFGREYANLLASEFDMPFYDTKWRDFTYYHSRFLAKRDGRSFSRLCVADKLAFTLEPWWFYLPRVKLTGEIDEYVELAAAQRCGRGKYADDSVGSSESALTHRGWFESLSIYMRQWVEEHKFDT